jgi:hypothetical protein
MSIGHYFETMVVLWTVVAVLGGLVAAYAFLAWRSRRSPPMLALGLGLLLLSVGPALEWVGMYLYSDDLYATSMGCAVVLAAGFACLLVAARSRLS